LRLFLASAAVWLVFVAPFLSQFLFSGKPIVEVATVPTAAAQINFVRSLLDLFV
jgi:hypothetical protein